MKPLSANRLIWLPPALWLIAIALTAAASNWVDASLAFGAFYSLLVIGAALFAISFIASTRVLFSARRESFPRAQLTSAAIGLVISAAYLGYFSVQAAKMVGEDAHQNEHGAFWEAIRDNDTVGFSRALASRKFLALDSPLAFQSFLLAIEANRRGMAAEFIQAGMPLFQKEDAHPELTAWLFQPLFRPFHSGDTHLIATDIVDVASKAGENRVEALRAALNRAIAAEHARNPQVASDAALRKAMAHEINNNPKLSFAASLSAEALRAASKGHYPELSERNARDETVLFFAVRDEKHCGFAPELITAGVDFHVANIFGVTPLMLAAANCPQNVVGRLLERKVDPNEALFGGLDALMYASAAGRVDNVRRLLAAGANANRKTKKGETALSLARQKGFEDVVKLLKQEKR